MIYFLLFFKQDYDGELNKATITVLRIPYLFYINIKYITIIDNIDSRMQNEE